MDANGPRQWIVDQKLVLLLASDISYCDVEIEARYILGRAVRHT